MTWAVLRQRLIVVATLMISAGSVCVAKSNDRAPMVGRVVPIQISKPGQLALAATGDRLAITDRYANRITVMDTRGNLLWPIGEGVTLNQPYAVMMVDAATILFGEWGSCRVFRVSENTPKTIDTVADLSSTLGDRARIRRMYTLHDGTILVLSENPDRLVRYAADWKAPQEIIPEGSGKGKLDRSADCALLSTGRLAISGGGHSPVQLFDLSGRLLTITDWNSPTPKTGWVASAITTDQQERIWAADLTHAKYRIYDLSGTLADEIPFGSPLAKPCEMEITPDNQLFVVDENGRVEIYDLVQE